MRTISNQLIQMCEEMNIRYSSKIVTNGLSLKENIFEELVLLHRVNHIEVTLDGTSKYHDQRRHTKDGNKTFDVIFNNLKRILNKENYKDYKCDISIRCNVDERNFESVSGLINLLANNQFQNKISYFYPIGVYSWGNDAHEKSMSKEEFAEKEIDWLIEMLKAGFKPKLLPGRVKNVCMAVTQDSEMYDAYGNIYNCTEVSYVDTYKVGCPTS